MATGGGGYGMFYCTTALSLIETKIERNITMIEIYEIENQIIKKEMVMRYRLTQINEKKIASIKKINEIEEKQKFTYNEVRAAEVVILIDKVNNTELEFSDIRNEVDVLYQKRTDLLYKLKSLENKIPQKTMITNFKVKTEPDNIK